MKLYEKIDGRLSPDDVESLVQEAVADQLLEGIKMTPEEIDKLRDYAHGRITKAEYDAWVRESVTA